MQAIEALGEIDKEGRIVLDDPLEAIGKRVKVIILLSEVDEIPESDWTKNINKLKSFEFLEDEAEDIYTLKDGTSVEDEG
jgi:hypothetical protein